MKIGKGKCLDIVATNWGFVVLNNPTDNKL